MIFSFRADTTPDIFSVKLFRTFGVVREAYGRPIGADFGAITLEPPSENRVPLPFGVGETLFSEGGFNVMLDTEIRTYGSPVCFPTSGIFKGVAWGEFVREREKGAVCCFSLQNSNP